MREFLAAAALAALILPAPAGAQEKAPIWSGIYVGAHAGYGWGDGTADLAGSSGAIHYNDPFLPADQSPSLGQSEGWIGGFQIGANQQFGTLVAGIEADVSWADIGDDITTGISVQGAQWDISSNLDLYGTIRGKLGLLVTPSLLVYGTGGMAWGQFDVRQATTFVNGNGDWTDDGGRTSGTFNHIGYVIGGGAEWALSSNLFLRAEYLYLDFGKENYALGGTTKPDPSDPNYGPYVETFAAEHDLHTFRLGVSYKFD